MLQLALSAGTACILAYGQTGSGKTYTMESLEFRIARDLFVVADTLAARLVAAGHAADAKSAENKDAADAPAPSEAKHQDVFEFSVTFLELLGKRAVDLLEPADGLKVDEFGNPIRTEVVIHEDKVRFDAYMRRYIGALTRFDRTVMFVLA